MELVLWIRQMPIVNILNQPIYYDGTSPSNIQVIQGTLPQQRQWASFNNFIDVTEDASDLNKITLQWSEQRDSQGNETPGVNQLKKGVAGSVSISGNAYDLIKSWLIDDVSASFNQVEVKIEDTSCGYYEGYTIKSRDLVYCESGFCEFTLNIQQKDDALTCIRKTLIADNWQGWFQNQPAGGKKHPRMSYCVEKRPNGLMIMLWWLAGVVMMPTLFAMIPILLLINSIVFAINGLIAVVNLFSGNPINTNMIPFIDFKDIMDMFSQFYIESAGCGREHPSPLIRDYITNVCDRCGVGYDHITAPIFFAQTITIETSDPARGIITTNNPHYNATYFSPSAKRGIRRFNGLNIFGGASLNTSDWFIEDNRPLLTLDMFLDELCKLYNCEWRVKNGMLYFWRKDWFIDSGYLYDFSENGADREKILEGICFETNDFKIPASCIGLYKTDGADPSEAGGGNGNGQMNGLISFVNNAPTTQASALIDNNPLFEGILDKTANFGATKFNLDGASQCYYYDAMQVVANGAIFTPFSVPQMALTAKAFKEYADHALLLQGEITSLPKVIIWDGESYGNAKAIKVKSCVNGNSPYPMPDVNPYYNKTPLAWDAKHPPITKVTGDNLTLGSAPYGVYKVTDYFGLRLIENPALLPNYPMFFEPGYYDTMWDWFHWIDDPKRNPRLNQAWRLRIPYCCEDAKKLGILNSAEGIELGRAVKGTNVYFPDMKIEEITVVFNTEDQYGMNIELKGSL